MEPMCLLPGRKRLWSSEDLDGMDGIFDLLSFKKFEKSHDLENATLAGGCRFKSQCPSPWFGDGRGRIENLHPRFVCDFSFNHAYRTLRQIFHELDEVSLQVEIFAVRFLSEDNLILTFFVASSLSLTARHKMTNQYSNTPKNTICVSTCVSCIYYFF